MPIHSLQTARWNQIVHDLASLKVFAPAICTATLKYLSIFVPFLFSLS